VRDVWTLGVTDSAGIGAASDACDDEDAPRLSFIGECVSMTDLGEIAPRPYFGERQVNPQQRLRYQAISPRLGTELALLGS
jgi:hypothetical protein